MSKSKQQTGGPKQAKTKKPKTLPDRLKYYAEFFRTLPDTQRPLVGFGDDIKQYQKAPYRPTELWLLNAGGYVHRVLRIGGFKEYENQLLAAFNKGGEISLWQELVTILRAKANLPCGFMQDYLKTFAKDCELVADALLAETQEIKWDNEPNIMQKEAHFKLREILKREQPKIQQAGRLPTVRDLAKEIGCSPALLSKEKGACRILLKAAREGLKVKRKPKERRLTGKMSYVRPDDSTIDPAKEAEQRETIGQLEAEQERENAEQNKRGAARVKLCAVNRQGNTDAGD